MFFVYIKILIFMCVNFRSIQFIWVVINVCHQQNNLQKNRKIRQSNKIKPKNGKDTHTSYETRSSEKKNSMKRWNTFKQIHAERFSRDAVKPNHPDFWWILEQHLILNKMKRKAPQPVTNCCCMHRTLPIQTMQYSIVISLV